jgi:hypothetical protein
VDRIIEAAVISRRHGDYQPTRREAEEAACFRGKVQPGAVANLMAGRFMQTSVEMVSQDIATRWRPKTQSAKARAARQFQAFVKAVGMSETIFPSSEQIPTKTKHQTGVEEDALTAFALHRAMLGQSPKGTCTTVSHVRTWHETIFKEELGRVGTRAKASPTSQCVQAMKGYYTIKDHSCVKRRPMNRGLVKLVLIESRRNGRDDVGVAVLAAFAGLFRMGELAASEGACDPIEDMAERDLQFVPNFWDAKKVIINMGRSKADQDGARSKLRPRILPVDDDLMSPGRALRNLIAERHGCRQGRTPTLGATPLFQDDRRQRRPTKDEHSIDPDEENIAAKRRIDDTGDK